MYVTLQGTLHSIAGVQGFLRCTQSFINMRDAEAVDGRLKSVRSHFSFVVHIKTPDNVGTLTEIIQTLM